MARGAPLLSAFHHQRGVRLPQANVALFILHLLLKLLARPSEQSADPATGCEAAPEALDGVGGLLLPVRIDQGLAPSPPLLLAVLHMLPRRRFWTWPTGSGPAIRWYLLRSDTS